MRESIYIIFLGIINKRYIKIFIDLGVNACFIDVTLVKNIGI